jgi:hypothetical protein
VLLDDRSDVGEELVGQRFALSVKLGRAASIGIWLEVTLLVQGPSGLAGAGSTMGTLALWLSMVLRTVPHSTTPNLSEGILSFRGRLAV